MFARQRVFYGFCPSLAFCTANIRRKLSESCFRLQNYNFFLRTKHIHPPIFRNSLSVVAVGAFSVTIRNKKRQPKLTLFCLYWSPVHVGYRKLFQFDGIAAGTS